MPRIRKFNRKSFKGNQFTKSSISQHQLPLPTPENKQDQSSSSSKKLSGSKLPKDYEYETNDVNLIVNLKLLSKAINSFTKCISCSASNCITIRIDADYNNGIAHKLVLECTECNFCGSFMNTETIRNKHELNIRYAYALRSIGKGLEAGKMFSAIMNLAPPNSRMQTLYQRILPSLTEVCDASLRNAAAEAVEENEGSQDIAAAFDGTWQRRGFKSLNGVITVTSFDTGKVLDFECMSKFCINCARDQYKNDEEKLEEHKKVCKANYAGSSGGMEVVGASIVCQRSVDKLRVRYIKYLGDGDSKGFQSVSYAKPYGQEVEIENLECVGHIQKRLGTRLRNLKNTVKGRKLSDGKVLGGKGRLTDTVIDNLQRYYGLAIRINTADVDKMRNAVWATYYLRLSTDQNPQHDLCPTDKDTWCKFHKARLTKTPYTHQNSLPEPVMLLIEPIYNDLSKPELLKRCLHGKTQNPNESVNGCIWKRLPKTEFVSLTTLQLGVTDAVLCYNEGAVAKVNVLQSMGIKPGRYTVEGLQTIDRRRIMKADKEAKDQNKKERIKRRLIKKNKEEEDTGDNDYCPGAF